jgi:uncharacterized protein (TIGR02391 family)
MEERDPYDIYDPIDDAPGPDEPENRLHFNELHPLIQEAAHEAWEAGDYHEAVIAAWHALRDRLRARLGSDADGDRLIRQINERAEGGDPPRLPLTDYDSETTRGMHNGLVSLLSGIVSYVRNPEQHEESFVRDDKIGALERLALLSLCARHVDVRTETVAADDALDELRQERFPDSTETRAELVVSVRGHERLAFARSLAEAARQATADGDTELATRCRNTFRQLTQHLDELGRDYVLTEVARDLDRLVSRDESLDLAIRLLTPTTFARLSSRNQQKVADRVLEDVEEGARTRAPRRGIFHRDAPRLFPALSPDDRHEFVRLVESAVRGDDPQRRTYGAWLASWISRSLNEAEMDRLALALAETIASGRSEIAAELERRRRALGYGFRRSLDEQLAQVRATSPETEAEVEAVRELLAPIARVRRVRSADERPS